MRPAHRASPEVEEADDDSVLPRTLNVRVDRDAVVEFRCATEGSAADPHVPRTYPVSWLAHPEVRDMIDSMLGGKGIVPVHEAQSFEYEQALEIGADYSLGVEMARTRAPPRLTVTATVTTLEGKPCVRIETVLRLVPVAREPVGPGR